MEQSDTSDKAWLAEQARIGRRAAWPLIGLGLGAAVLGAGQAFCAAVLLASVLVDVSRDGLVMSATGFAVLALARAAMGLAIEGMTFRLGAVARRRLRTDALSRLLAAGPALLRSAHSVELAAVVVDRIEGLDGFFARWVPAAVLAVATPAVLLVIVVTLDPVAALVLLATACLVPVAMALSGIGAGRAAQRQFTAMTRLQTRFLDRMRGIATIVLNGRIGDEAVALRAAAEELRVRTMRVLRVAFLSSVALDCAAAAAMIILALRAGAALAAGSLATPVATLFVLLLVPEYFAPLRSFSAAYQDRFQARAAAAELSTLPALPQPLPPRAVRTVEASGLTVAFDNVSLVWDPARPPALANVSFRVSPGETLVLAGPSGAGNPALSRFCSGLCGRPRDG